MSKPLFVDTGYIIALINENDHHHRQALELSVRRACRARLIFQGAHGTPYRK